MYVRGGATVKPSNKGGLTLGLRVVFFARGAILAGVKTSMNQCNEARQGIQ